MSTLTLLFSRGGQFPSFRRVPSPALGFFQAAPSLRRVNPNIKSRRDLTWKTEDKTLQLVRDRSHLGIRVSFLLSQKLLVLG